MHCMHATAVRSGVNASSGVMATLHLAQELNT